MLLNVKLHYLPKMLLQIQLHTHIYMYINWAKTLNYIPKNVTLIMI